MCGWISEDGADEDDSEGDDLVWHEYVQPGGP